MRQVMKGGHPLVLGICAGLAAAVPAASAYAQDTPEEWLYDRMESGEGHYLDPLLYLERKMMPTGAPSPKDPDAVDRAAAAAGRVATETAKGAVGGAVNGAAKGALTGAVVGGPPGAVKGALTGAALGATKGAAEGAAKGVLNELGVNPRPPSPNPTPPAAAPPPRIFDRLDSPGSGLGRPRLDRPDLPRGGGGLGRPGIDRPDYRGRMIA